LNAVSLRFRFVPSTVAGDGDPLDVLLLLDDSAPMGCVVRARAVGVIEARQREPKGDWIRNDRLIAVAVHAKLHADLKNIKELNPRVLDEEPSFATTTQMDGKEFEPLKRAGPDAAASLIHEAQEASGKKQAA